MAMAPQPPGAKKEPSIHEVILQGDVLKAQEMIQANDKLLRRTDESGRVPFHWACSLGQQELFDFILAKDPKFDVDTTDDSNLTPLIIAAAAGRIEIVKTLLERGADVNARNSGGHSALQYAASKNFADIVQLLLAKGANVNIVDNLNATPLHRAASQGHSRILLMLVDSQKIDLNARDSSGNTPLHLACEEDRAEEAKILLRHGADLETENKAKKKPLDLASKDLASTLKNIAEHL